MRFGKKTRNLAAAGRRFFGERERDEAPSALAAVEEAAYTDYEETAMTPPAPDEPMVAGDPTQRLLTALGRFQRQVSRAEEGASQDAWCDECMNQLIAGIEIALGEGWSDVKAALTDTARVLQTYEDANRASDCVHFLKDSYEILCLMVGDLIVDNVRSGVMKKWHARYEVALNELASQGLTLVDDDSAREREVDHHTIDTPDPFGPDAYDDGDNHGTAPDAGDAFDDFIGEGGGTDEEFSGHGSGASDTDPFSPVLENGLPFGTPREDVNGVDSTVLPSLDELLGGGHSPGDDDSDLGLSNDFTADEPEAVRLPQPFAHDDDGFAVHGELFETVAEDDEAVEEEMVVEEEVAAEEFAPASAAPMELDLSEPEPEPELEVAPVPEPAAVAAPEAEPEPGSALALLKTAQQAMALGNVADAKVFALQLAANMARLEADQVEARADAIKADIDVNIEEVAAAERTVADAEGRVRSLEEQNAQCQQEFEGKRQHVQELRSEVEAAEHSVADLERQIAELEARRDEERARLSERQTSLDDTLSEESRMQAELDTLAAEEEGARENLESARERVRALQEQGGSRQAELEAARLELVARQSAVEDIERTIGHVGGGTPPKEDQPEAGAGDESGNDHGA